MNMEMVCTCGADGVREVEERRLRIFRRMRLENMENLTEVVVLSLAFDFSCDANVYVDMWFGIAFETPLLPNEKLFLPCDSPHDGFAAIWEMLSERFPERVTAAPGKNPLGAAERISKSLLERYVETDRAYREHRSSAHAGPNDCPPCEDCDVLLSLMVSAHHALDVEWGSRSLDACVEAAFSD